MDYLDILQAPFKYGGRSLSDGGLDCYGVVVEMHRRNGIELPPRQFSENLAVNHALMATQMDEWERCECQPGAVALIRIMGHLCHIGFVINEYEFIHAWEGTTTPVVERIDAWQKRIEGFYRYVGSVDSEEE